MSRTPYYAADERTPLTQDQQPQQQPQQQDSSSKKQGSPLLQLPGRTASPHYHQTTFTEPSYLSPAHSINVVGGSNNRASPFGRARNHSGLDDVSVTSFGGASSIMGNEASPRDIQELLDNLEKATKLIRRHIQEQDGKKAPVPHPRPLIPRWVTKYLLLITFIWQTLNIGFLEVVDKINTDNRTRNDLNLASNIIMTAFQGVHLVLVFFVSFKLVKQVLHRTASGSLLAQCYLSTVLLFAGLYTLEYRFKNSGFIYVINDGSKPILLFLRMLYFSVSTATLCGTSEVEPVDWYSSLTVSVQMLMSFVYFASILSLGIIPRKNSGQDQQSETRFTEKLRKLRRWLFGSQATL